MNTSIYRVLVSTMRTRTSNLYTSQIVSQPIKFAYPIFPNNFVRTYSSLETRNLDNSVFMNKGNSKFLSPVQQTIIEQPKAGMKLVNNPKRRCKHCYIVFEEEKKFVFCDKFPRHKQAQKRPGWNMRVSRILTHATQGGIKSSARMGMWTQQGLREDY